MPQNPRFVLLRPHLGARPKKTAFDSPTLGLKPGDYKAAGRCAFKKERMWRTAKGIRSLGSFHGYMLISALGASIADSMATFNECASVSSGRISTGVWQLRTKSRVAVKTKSLLLRYALVRNLSTISMVRSGRRLTNSAPQAAFWLSYTTCGLLRPDPDGLRHHGRHNTVRGSLQKGPNERPANAEAHHHELIDAQVIQHAEVVIRIGVPRPVDLECAT